MNDIRILNTSFQPLKEIEVFQQEQCGERKNYGATASFIGTMRDFNEGDTVASMFLEHYPKMTQGLLENLIKKAEQQWDVLHTLLVHRVGDIEPGEPIVLVAVWSAHRAAAFEACRYLMEELKNTAPFWKREVLEDGSYRWVDKNTTSR